MTNPEIAKQIADIGDMLEILGDSRDQFRILAYHNAARKIEMMSEQLEEIYAKLGLYGLDQIPGIGKSISEKIEELIKTGKISTRDKLAGRIPRAVLEFTKILGVGPKLAEKLYQSYHSHSIEELKEKLANDQTENHFKTKTKENIIQGIVNLQQLSGRMLLSFAEPIAQEMVDKLKTYSQINQADMVGSLRRMKETIGDIDIIASLRQDYGRQASLRSNLKLNDDVIDRFIHDTFVKEIISHGETKASIIHKKGVQVDLEILPNEEYGSLLQHFTGSKEHNIALRTWAEEHGFSISEHGVKVLSKSRSERFKLIKCSREEKVYQTLGMDWMAPELREDRGEIKAALNHQLPKLVELKDIKGDLHLHTTWSEGDHSIREMANFCQDLGYQYIAITDHSAGLGITHGLKEKDVDKYLEEIKQINSQLAAPASRPASPNRGEQGGHNSHFRVLSGVECNIMADGKIDFSDQTLAKFDLVIAAIHSGFGQSQEKLTERLIKTINNPHIDIIAHPTGRLLERRQPLDMDWDQVFNAAVQTGTMMEINAQPDRLDLTDSLILIAKKYKIRVAINSDSHHHAHLLFMKYGVATARRGWLEKSDVINTLTLKEFEKWLEKR